MKKLKINSQANIYRIRNIIVEYYHKFRNRNIRLTFQKFYSIMGIHPEMEVNPRGRTKRISGSAYPVER